MFEYFPDNYGWSLSFMLALGMGAEIAELETICQPLRAVAGRGDHASELEWMTRWSAGAQRLRADASKDEQRRHRTTASRKWFRASMYSQLAERQLGIKDEASLAIYREGLASFARGAELSDVKIEFVDIPCGKGSLPALFISATDPRTAPCMIHFDGLDVMKELIYLMHADELRAGRISMLICDHAGVGEALRLRGLHLTEDTETYAAACLDYLALRGDVNLARTGIVALSLGGYYAPRAAAMEPRLRFCAAWGAIWNTRACVENCIAAGTGSVPLVDQFRWVLGVDDTDEVWRRIDQLTLEPIIERLKCPLLVLHGENDRQAPVWTAHATYDGAKHSSRRDLVIIPTGSPGCEHCQVDALSIGTSILHDWVMDVV